MRELKRNISGIFKEYKLAWIDEFDKAQNEKRKFKLSNVARQEAEIYNKMDNFFSDAEERLQVQMKKKGGMFGK